MSDIKPTVGRVLHFHPSRELAAGRGMVLLCQGDPMDAHLVYVHRSGLVNLAVFDHAGNQHAITDVKLLQDADQAPLNEQGQLIESYAAWMPYQKGQAEKTEALERQVSGCANSFKPGSECRHGHAGAASGTVISERVREICHAIERCGASPELTHAVTLASDLLSDLQRVAVGGQGQVGA
ncbi:MULTISPECIES: hypothetical protein [unclassified Pseudomonas]|uniref:hypothetical protein n=1 Tax=unclassified Pseudomonas TaxID=196821 RepID=UPI00244C28C8|nr:MULTISPECIES: hypothetical protein [unclassified Pseudomonas]MDG9927393.1 hypothetical protein [Pseudomonas sp. GD04042]MDH0482462.1 hypothetical protein [Pseudomonas sp. GD04015]MDH0602814.1 hypothetical protein [Pseudomonas sp. GD03869]